jgi:hypothetical protein
MTGHVCVRTRYYKSNAAIAVLDHANALRNGFTRSQNVIPALSGDNVGVYFSDSNSSLEAFEKMCIRYKETTGKKCRSDFNALFEHILIFSADTYDELEKKHGHDRLKNAMLGQTKMYATEIQKRFGFEPLGIDLHLDEGTFDPITGKTKRNVHAHVQFFNYDFDKKIAPLRHLMRKGKDENGQTHQLNPNFVMMQDIAGDLFSKAGFKRGETRDVTGRKHMEKEAFVRHKLSLMEQEIQSLQTLARDMALAIKQKTKVALSKVMRSVDKVLGRQHLRRM